MVQNVNDYLVFYQVAVFKNMRNAARELNITPPSVSRIIQELEEKLGCQLFIRSKRGAQLTDAGEALFARIKPALSLIQSGEDEARMFANLEAGKIVVGVGDMTARYFLLPYAVKTFCQLYPKITVRLKHLSKPEAEEMLSSGEIDLAVMSSASDWDTELIDELPLFTESDIAVVGDEYAFLLDRELTIEELAEYPLIFVPERFGAHAFYEKLFESHGLKLSPMVETTATEEQIMAVANGIGYTFVPEITALDEIEKGHIHRLSLKEELLQRKISLFTPRKFPVTGAAGVFIDVIKESIGIE
jgi:DNA-binding transcriptional LysR family regulator